MKRENRVLLLMPELEMGGAEAQMRYLLNQAEIMNWKIDVIIEHRYSNKNKRGALLQNESQIIRFFEWNIKNVDNKKMMMLLVNHFRKNVFSVKYKKCLIYHTADLVFVPLLRLMNIKVVYSERVNASAVRELPYYIEYLKMCNMLVANSVVGQKELQVLSRRKVQLVRNGIQQVVMPEIRGKGEIKRLLVPARIAPVKNQMIVLHMLSKNLDKNWKLVFAGVVQDKHYFTRMKRYIERERLQDRVEFVGYVENMQEQYEMADLIILPSLAEGTPNVILEAFLYGKPAIVSDIEAERDIVKNVNLRFDLKNSQEMMDCISYLEEMSQEDYLKMLKKNREYVLRNYSVERMAEKYYRLLTN